MQLERQQEFIKRCEQRFEIIIMIWLRDESIFRCIRVRMLLLWRVDTYRICDQIQIEIQNQYFNIKRYCLQLNYRIYNDQYCWSGYYEDCQICKIIEKKELRKIYLIDVSHYQAHLLDIGQEENDEDAIYEGCLIHGNDGYSCQLDILNNN